MHSDWLIKSCYCNGPVLGQNDGSLILPKTSLYTTIFHHTTDVRVVVYGWYDGSINFPFRKFCLVLEVTCRSSFSIALGQNNFSAEPKRKCFTIVHRPLIRIHQEVVVMQTVLGSLDISSVNCERHHFNVRFAISFSLFSMLTDEIFWYICVLRREAAFQMQHWPRVTQVETAQDSQNLNSIKG